MSDTTAQEVQKLLTDAIRKQMIILGPQITLLKTRNVHSLTITDDGAVVGINGNPQTAVTQFLEQFRDLSAPLVKKTMQPLLSTISPVLIQETTQPSTASPQQALAVSENSIDHKVSTSEIQIN